MQNFNFDEWSALAKSAPDEFETRRNTMIESVIENCTDARRLRGLQCRIDLERARARTPLKACLRLSSLMWDSLYECHDHLNRLAYTDFDQFQPAPPTRRKAKILKFTPRKP